MTGIVQDCGSGHLMAIEFGHAFNIYKRLLHYVKPYTGRLVIASVAMLGVAATSAASALLIKNVLDDVFINKNRQLLLLIPAAIIIVYLFRGVCRYVRSYLMASAGVRMVRDIRNDLYRHLHRLSMSYFTETPTGTLMSRVTYDVSMIQGAVTEALTGAIRDVFMILALAGVVLYRSPVLGAISLLAAPLAFYPLVQFGRRMKRSSRKSQEQMGDLTKLMQEKIAGIGLVKASGTEDEELERFKTHNERMVGTFLKIQRVQAMSSPVMELIGAFSIALIIWIGGVMVIDGKMTVGEFFSFLTALMMLYEPIKHINSVNNMIQQGLAAAERVFELLDISPDVTDAPDAVRLPHARGKIQFKNVSFRYDKEWVLRDINLEIDSGMKLAIVGTSGGGKSTLINLIPRFYDVTEGSVEIDGYDVRSVTQKSLRNQISVVSQEIVLFNDTIKRNICYGIDDVSDEKLFGAIEAAYAQDFINSLPGGVETVVGERGTRLSGGQRQRLSIARAILKESPILILDEATSSLDTESESLVQKALDNLIAERTTLIIAHRISTVTNAERIIVISKGRIVESGPHNELIELKGEYSRLYSLLVENG